MTRGWWMVFGALGGACILGFAAALAWMSDAALLPRDWLMVGPVVGVVLGGFLGSRALAMARPVRVAIGALWGAALCATVGGVLFFFGGGSNAEWPNYQGEDFVIGAIVGGMAGLVAGGYVGGRTAASNVEGR